MDELLLKLALNLNDTLSSDDRFRRLLDVIAGSLPCDSACLFGVEDEDTHPSLVPLASYGLDSSVSARRFVLSDHPRLSILANAPGPVVFPADSELADPFDGLVSKDKSACLSVHSCFGCPLRVEGKVVGILVADALEPGKFDDLDMDVLSMIAALAGATLRTSRLIEALEKQAREESAFRKSLVADVNKAKNVPFLGVSDAIGDVRNTVAIVAPSELSILITGETGVGKEIVARMIHRQSLRREGPLIYVNCAALPESIVESELFGHVKGAFTGAISERMGKFQLAKGGTIFLDEVGELPLAVQAKLLRVLQEGEVQRVGSDSLVKVDVRVVAATNRDLAKEVSEGKFRADLFHRLNVFPLHVPSLRERREDIPILVSYYGDVFQRRFNSPPLRLSKEAQDLLVEYSWPGNVRELKNVLSRAALGAKYRSGATKVLSLCQSDFSFLKDNVEILSGEEFVDSARRELISNIKVFDSDVSLRHATSEFQKELILTRVQAHRGNWSAAASSLGMHRANLYRAAVKLGIK